MVTTASSVVDPPRVRPLVCDWDASSTKPGTSSNSQVWRELLAEVPGLLPAVVLNRRLGELIPPAVTSCTLAALDAGEIPLLLGGDHRLTYDAVKAVVHRTAGVQVHHFDAHHDAHPSPTLSNFSVFDHLSRNLAVPVVRYGCRESPLPTRDPATLPQAVPAQAAYLSIDLDYLDPDGFSCVSFPVPVPAEGVCTVRSLTALITSIRASQPIVGFDIVEWCGHRANNQERQAVVEVLTALVQPVASR